ncbi:MAG: CBS domain-containing protein [Deltaproteobacteria bacterium]|nr:CBS domain-containing protein [Deltaproteobacteria bacterium]
MLLNLELALCFTLFPISICFEIAHIKTPYIQNFYKDFLRVAVWGVFSFFYAHLISSLSLIPPSQHNILIIIGIIAFIFIPYLLSHIQKLQSKLSFLKIVFEPLPHKQIQENKQTDYQNEMVQKYKKLKKTQIQNIMTPFEKVFSLNASKTIEDALPEIKSTGFSRVPLYTDSPKKILSILYAKDVLTHIWSHKEKNLKIAELAHPLVKMIPSFTAQEALKILQTERKHFAVIVDQKNNMLGIVTIEDILEQLVGEIKDERDI